MNYFKLFILLMAALCVVSVSCAANQAGAVVVAMDEEAANAAVTKADAAIKKSTEKTSAVLQSATDTKTETCGLEDEKNKATNAKSEAEKLATDVSEADDTKKKVTDAVSKAEEKFKDLCTKAGDALTKAKKADEDAKKAKEALETAKITAKDSTGDTYKDRIDKVKEEETKAKNAEEAANAAEKEVDEIVKCISEFKTSVENAHIGLSEIKVFVEVDKAKKAYESVQEPLKGVNEIQGKTSNNLNEIDQMLIGTTDEMLKVKLQKQRSAAETANVGVQKEVANAKNGENNAKRFKEEVERELEKVKAATTVNDASNAQTKGITAANNAHDEITKAQTALDNAKKEFESSEKAKHRAKALVSAFKANTEYEKAKQHHEETKQKKSEINEQSVKIDELLKDASDSLKKKTESHKTLADEAVINAVTQVTNAGNAEKEALKNKQQADNAVNSALQETTTLNDISKASNAAETEATNAKQQTEKANNALKEVTKIWTTASLSRYRIVAIVAVSKAEETIQKMEQKVNEAKEQNLEAENAVNAIQKLKDSISTEMQTKIDPILQKAQTALQSIIARSTKMEQNMEKVKEKKGEAEAVMNAIIGKDDVTVEIAQNKSVEAETAAIAVESELLKANNAFSSVFAETEKAKKTQYEANIIITVAKINESFESTKRDHVSVVEKKSLIDTYVNEINALQTDTPKNVVSELTRLIGEAQKSQTTAADEVKKANTAYISAKEEHDKWSNTFEEIKNVQTKEKMQLLFDQTNVSFLVVQNAASNANRALKATETAELNALRANLHAVALVADAKATLYVKNAKKDFDMLSEIKVKIIAHKNEMLSIMQNAPTTLHEELRGKQEIVHNAQNEFNTEVIHAQKAVTNTEKYKNIAASALANVMSKETPLNNANALAQQGKEAAVNALKEAEIVKNVLLSAQNAEKRSSNATREAKKFVEKMKESTKQPNVSTTTHTPLNTETKETDKEETLAISTEVDAKDKDTDSKTDESRKEENEKTEKKNVEESSSDDKIIKEEKQASKTVDNTSLLENHDADFIKKKTSDSTAFTNLVNERTLQAMLFLMLIIFQL